MSQLVVEPSSLQFPLTLNKEVVQLLFVSNRSSRRTVTFKVKTTSPRRYSVRPTRGILWPGDQEQITITLRALRKPPSDADDCRDRFKVLSLDDPNPIPNPIPNPNPNPIPNPDPNPDPNPAL
jgi:hypothetical protein